VPESGDVARLPRILQVPGPPGRHEPVRRSVRDLAGLRRVQAAQDRDGLQQVIDAGAAGEPDSGQHIRDELAQVGHGGIHHRQMPVIAGQPLAAGLPRRPHPLVADIPAQPRTDLVVADLRVQHDLQDVVQQRLPVLPAAGALGQRFGQPCPCG
jgi:hypothetical protein